MCAQAFKKILTEDKADSVETSEIGPPSPTMHGEDRTSRGSRCFYFEFNTYLSKIKYTNIFAFQLHEGFVVHIWN